MGCDLVIDREAGCLRAFQSTHPVWDATRADEALRAIVNFNPRIPYGMRPGWLTLSMLLLLNFNPRIPYGMRRNRAPILTNKLLFQSTHPVWDATQTLLMTSHFVIFQSTHPVWDATSSSRSITARINFNPRIPYEMRQTSSCRALVTVIFQSTHPVWDATFSYMCPASRHEYFNPRIPYGMRPRQEGMRPASRYFNPRIPYGMRPTPAPTGLLRSRFQSTHPVWDATFTNFALKSNEQISIHASRMGCDTLDIARRAVTYRDFNPRIPYGMRQRSFDFRCVIIAFQSTHPVWDATQAQDTQAWLDANFNPRIPYGMRLAAHVDLRRVAVISIHASRMGCDFHNMQCWRTSCDFNPRIPYGMRQQRRYHHRFN